MQINLFVNFVVLCLGGIVTELYIVIAALGFLSVLSLLLLPVAVVASRKMKKGKKKSKSR